MGDYKISVCIEIKTENDEEATALGANARRVLEQYFPAHQVLLNVYAKPLDPFCRLVA